MLDLIRIEVGTGISHLPDVCVTPSKRMSAQLRGPERKTTQGPPQTSRREAERGHRQKMIWGNQVAPSTQVGKIRELLYFF